MKAKHSKESGFTLVEVMVVAATIGILTAIAVPNFVKAREISQKNTCVSNLKQIECAVSTWGLEKGKANGDPIVGAQLFGINNYIRVEPTCPAQPGTPYTLANVGDDPQVVCPSGVASHVLP